MAQIEGDEDEEEEAEDEEGEEDEAEPESEAVAADEAAAAQPLPSLPPRGKQVSLSMIDPLFEVFQLAGCQISRYHAHSQGSSSLLACA
jgi:hypothetical protein